MHIISSVWVASAYEMSKFAEAAECVWFAASDSAPTIQQATKEERKRPEATKC